MRYLHDQALSASVEACWGWFKGFRASPYSSMSRALVAGTDGTLSSLCSSRRFTSESPKQTASAPLISCRLMMHMVVMTMMPKRVATQVASNALTFQSPKNTTCTHRTPRPRGELRSLIPNICGSASGLQRCMRFDKHCLWLRFVVVVVSGVGAPSIPCDLLIVLPSRSSSHSLDLSSRPVRLSAVRLCLRLPAHGARTLNLKCRVSSAKADLTWTQ